MKKSSVSSQQGRLRRVKQKDIILTAKHKNELKTLKKRTLNLSDENAAEIAEWKNAMIGKFYRPIKQQITVRIDVDVLDWFKHATKKYQTLINKACREYMQHHSGIVGNFE